MKGLISVEYHSFEVETFWDNVQSFRNGSRWDTAKYEHELCQFCRSQRAMTCVLRQHLHNECFIFHDNPREKKNTHTKKSIV